MLKYKAYTYELWGNARDGWEVNDVFYNSTIDIPETITDASDEKFYNYLKKIGFIPKNFKNALFSVDGESDYTLYFEYKNKPAFELRRE
jgi:hypothetical protein